MPQNLDQPPDLLRSALTVSEIHALLLLDERRELREVRSLAQHRDKAEGFAIVGVAYKPKTDLTINPGLDAKASNVHDHCGGMRNGLFQSCHPGVAWLQIVFVEPDLKTVAAQYFRELTSRLRVCASVTEKYVALAQDEMRRCSHGA